MKLGKMNAFLQKFDIFSGQTTQISTLSEDNAKGINDTISSPSISNRRVLNAQPTRSFTAAE